MNFRPHLRATKDARASQLAAMPGNRVRRAGAAGSRDFGGDRSQVFLQPMRLPLGLFCSQLGTAAICFTSNMMGSRCSIAD